MGIVSKRANFIIIIIFLQRQMLLVLLKYSKMNIRYDEPDDLRRLVDIYFFFWIIGDNIIYRCN